MTTEFVSFEVPDTAIRIEIETRGLVRCQACGSKIAESFRRSPDDLDAGIVALDVRKVMHDLKSAIVKAGPRGWGIARDEKGEYLVCPPCLRERPPRARTRLKVSE